MDRLPIDDHLPELTGLLRLKRSLVLVANPGTGKTTRVAPALLGADWLRGRVLLLQPRRVAARAAAHRIAAEQGWKLGREVGYRTRFDRRVSAVTRLEVLTEGILTRRLQADPLLEGVGAVILDEFHERSLHSDLALALLKEVQQAREELRVLVMSATLDPGPVAEYLEGGAVRTIAAPLHPIETCYALQRRRGPLEQSVAATVRRALVEAPQQGDVLVFLPGMSEIRRVAETLAPTMEVEVLALHGSLPGPQQDRALRRSDRRRIVLATNVAETSVTVEGVTSVVDSGLMRLPRFDPARGINQLELTHISRASADQRAGRAGRLGPGRAYRLWTESEHASLAAHTPPEVRRVDLARVVLELRAWGADPEQFDWFEAPEPSALQRAAEFLRRIGALDRATGAVTSTGRALLDLPLHPRLAQLLLSACAHGYPRSGATLAALLGERDILRGGEHSADLPTARSDLLIRMELLDLAEQNQFRSTPQLWADVDLRAAREVARVRDDLYQAVSDAPQRSRSSSRARSSSGSETEPSESALLSLILTAYPDRVVRRREAGSTRGLMVGGRGVMLDRRSVVREEQFFIALVIDRGGRDARVRLASGIDREWLRTRDEHTCRFDPTSERVVAQRKLMFDDLCLSAHPCAPDPEQASEQLLGWAAKDPLASLRPDESTQQFLDRLSWLHAMAPELNLPNPDPKWLGSLLPSLCFGKSSLAQLRAEPLIPALCTALSAEQRTALEQLAPERITLPSGRRARLTYRQDAPPLLAAPVQELFGLADTPRILGGRAAVLIDLLAPNRRPVQRTQDLRSFWNTTYSEVRKELRRRYPKHAWPEDPWSAPPTTRPRHRRR